LRLGEPLTGRLLSFDALSMRFRETRLPRDPACPGCGSDAVFQGYEDIERFCATGG
jgi:sulfur-carrier protein adenylyltransferase/sulfurtransferase